ncbi:MAG: hypothetical protein HYY04_07100 [Chloroflexi bacterium]|nr:hypothetical protein [Chloroflexota bacterium]
MHPGLRREPQRIGWLSRWRLLRQIGDVVRASPSWSDRVWLGLLATAVAANLGLYAVIWLSLPTLPAFLPLRYGPEGVRTVGAVIEIGARSDLFRVPAIGSAVLLTNLAASVVIHRRERLAALLLQAGAVVVQGMLVIAALQIIRLAFGE